MKIKLYLTGNDLMRDNHKLWLEEKDYVDFNLIMPKILASHNKNDFKVENNELKFSYKYMKLVFEYLILFCSYGNDDDKLNEINYYLEELGRDYQL